MADYTVTLHFSPEQQALIDKLRGPADLSDFIRDVVVSTVEEIEATTRLMSNGEPFVDGDEDLTPEAIIRLADEADADAMDFDEFAEAVWADFEELKAQYGNSAAR
jgi:hypothetical protein